MVTLYVITVVLCVRWEAFGTNYGTYTLLLPLVTPFLYVCVREGFGAAHP